MNDEDLDRQRRLASYRRLAETYREQEWHQTAAVYERLARGEREPPSAPQLYHHVRYPIWLAQQNTT